MRPSMPLRPALALATVALALAPTACRRRNPATGAAPGTLPMNAAPGPMGAFPAAPGLAPGMPGAPAMPGMPGYAPGMPGAPAMPGYAPGMPAMPTMPTMPAAVPTPAAAMPAVMPSLPPPPPAGADPRAVRRMTTYTIEKMHQGYIPVGNPGADTLTTGADRSFDVTLNAGDCYTVAAFGGAGVRDLDVFMYAPGGNELVHDVATDSRPVVNTCVQATGSYRVRFLMYAGNGPYTYQLYRNPGAAAAATGIAGVDPVVRRRMDQFSGRLAARGFRPLPDQAGAGFLQQGQAQDFTVTLADAQSCYAFVGFAGTGMSDLDVYLRDAAGTELRRDIAIDPVADVKYFVAMPGAYVMHLNAYSGSGPIAYQVYERPGQRCP